MFHHQQDQLQFCQNVLTALSGVSVPLPNYFLDLSILYRRGKRYFAISPVAVIGLITTIRPLLRSLSAQKIFSDAWIDLLNLNKSPDERSLPFERVLATEGVSFTTTGLNGK